MLGCAGGVGLGVGCFTSPHRGRGHGAGLVPSLLILQLRFPCAELSQLWFISVSFLFFSPLYEAKHQQRVLVPAVPEP